MNRIIPKQEIPLSIRSRIPAPDTIELAELLLQLGEGHAIETTLTKQKCVTAVKLASKGSEKEYAVVGRNKKHYISIK